MSANAPDTRPWWRKLSVGQLRWLALIALFAVTAAFGGLQKADHVTDVELGTPYDDGPLTITITSVSAHDTVPELPTPAPECVFVVVDATVENTADRSVSFPDPMAVFPVASNCQSDVTRRQDRTVELDGIQAVFVGAVRGAEGILVPGVEPGFTDNVRLMWTVPRADLAKNPQLSIRLPQMKLYISTFRIAEDWGGQADRYGVVQLPRVPTP